MQLFEPDNVDIDGVDNINACYGGTAALFNAVNWCESRAYDGRLALVVAADVAVYANGPARCTGGAGAVAMLIGPNAPLVLDQETKTTCMRHVYDFYKPDLSSEYPYVNGKLSIDCYIGALDNCYRNFQRKFHSTTGNEFRLDDADALLFHTPFCKLVQKSVARLFMHDYFDCAEQKRVQIANGIIPALDESMRDKMWPKEIESAFVKVSGRLFKAKTDESLLLSRRIGNMYTASLYACLGAYLAQRSVGDLCGQRLVMFSYGSGLAASMFALKVSKEPSQKLQALVDDVSDLIARLDARQETEPAAFAEMMQENEEHFNKAPVTAAAPISQLLPGTYYLKSVDNKFIREYGICDE